MLMEIQCVPYNSRIFATSSDATSCVAEDNPHQQLRNQLLSTLDLFNKNCYDARLESLGIKKHHSFNNEMQRREQFGVMLDALETVGLDRDVARQELLILIAGEDSTVLNQYME